MNRIIFLKNLEFRFSLEWNIELIVLYTCVGVKDDETSGGAGIVLRYLRYTNGK